MGKLEKLSDADQISIVNEYGRGLSLKELAKSYDCTAPTVATFIRKKGGVIRGKGKVRGSKKPVDAGLPAVVEDDGLPNNYVGQSSEESNIELEV